jgi:hypothetical protein
MCYPTSFSRVEAIAGRMAPIEPVLSCRGRSTPRTVMPSSFFSLMP